ncbi:integrase [Burkholderia ubonensis]|uniref:tyrosine-type recombinase/integrase n=1 Tax=Burkholderia ubonensis TaxID=101571 RepID=UPI00075CE6DB|nr:tyrosine-type recombinase/integrase [Burkholderia ubonensis]KVV46717.1 integrase [Burkholderia ubonensis]KVW13729.1 integrase [Burkholderia ubonensis]
MMATTNFGSVLARFFQERLIAQMHASPHTLHSYRDTFRLFLKFIHARTGTQPSKLSWDDVDATTICTFLDDQQERRGITARTRNLRLTAIRSLFKYAAFELPEHSSQIQQVLAIPPKRVARQQIGYLTRPELGALLAAPDRNTWPGRRDYAWILLATQTGLRLSELTSLKRTDINLSAGACVHVTGKGRKERWTPLTNETMSVLEAWLKELPAEDAQIVFPSRRGARMSNDGVQYLLTRHVDVARRSCMSLRAKRVSPHVLRHTAAMNLLEAGVDTTVIAMWLGHESVETTRVYLEADLELKRRMLSKTSPTGAEPASFRPDDALLTFLRNL